jgi:hypothetical protein
MREDSLLTPAVARKEVLTNGEGIHPAAAALS